MILVEFLDKNSIDNIAGTLLLNPDIVVFVGCHKEPPEKMLDDYRLVLKSRGLECEIRYCGVLADNPESFAAVLSPIAEREDCVFNINGGKEVYLVGLGMVYAKYPDKVKLHMFDSVEKSGIKLTAEECIRIYGGKSSSADKWEYTKEFCEDIKKLWKVSSVNTTVWNAQMATITFLQNTFKTDNDLKVSFDKREAKKRALAIGVKYVYYDTVFAALAKNGLIKNLYADGENVSFEYKNKEIKEIIEKSGTVLELYVDVAARETADADGNPLFDDVRTGLEIEWDRNPEKGEEITTKNEIDVVLMKKTVPIFISCKNGQVNVDELYKLSTVAENFGGKTAQKVLIAPNLDRLKGGEYIRLRAKDMGITVLVDTETVSFEEFIKQLSGIGEKR